MAARGDRGYTPRSWAQQALHVADSQNSPGNSTRDWCSPIICCAHHQERFAAQMLQETTCTRADGPELHCSHDVFAPAAEEISKVGSRFYIFTDEKIFTVASPSNAQNDRMCMSRDVKKRRIPAKRLLRCRSNFSKSLMVSVAMSKLGCSELFFVEPGVKVDGRYYRDVMLRQQLLPVMCRIARSTFVFQQDSAPAHRAHDTVQLLQMETPEFIGPDLWPPDSSDLNPMDYQVWGLMQERVYKTPIHDTADLKERLIEAWSGISQSVLDKAIDQWTVRLQACVKAKRH